MILHKLPILRKYPSLQEFVKFGIVGIGNTILHFTTYYTLTRRVEYFDSHILLANFLAFVVAVFFSFVANKYWTFQSYGRRRLASQYFKFVVVSSVGLGITEIILYTAVNILGLNDLMALAGAIVVVMFWNFFMNKRWTFRSG